MFVATPALSAYAASARVEECCCGLHSVVRGDCGCPNCPSRDKHPRRDGVLALRGCLPVGLSVPGIVTPAAVVPAAIAIPAAELQGVLPPPIPRPLPGYLAPTDLPPP